MLETDRNNHRRRAGDAHADQGTADGAFGKRVTKARSQNPVQTKANFASLDETQGVAAPGDRALRVRLPLPTEAATGGAEGITLDEARAFRVTKKTIRG